MSKYVLKCCVPNCSSTSRTRFGVPSLAKETWEKAIGVELKNNSKICPIHFNHDQIVDKWESGTGENKYSVSI